MTARYRRITMVHEPNDARGPDKNGRPRWSFNIDVVKQAYADASISIHFLYLVRAAQRTERIMMRGISDSTFSAFLEMSKATGGYVESSSRPDHLFQAALNASENYYLTYYTPQGYKSDGKFRTISVRVPSQDMQVTHRLGYFAE